MRSSRLRVGAAVLGLLALASGCGQKKGAAGVVRASTLGTYPKESVALLVLEVKRVRSLGEEAPWMKRLASLAEQEGGPFREVIERLGAGTIEQLGRLSLAVVPEAGPRVGYGILAEGSFDPVKIHAALGGRDLLTLVEAEGKPDFSVAVLPDGSLALGARRILDVMRGNAAARGHGLDANEALLAPLEQVRPEAQFWGALDCKSLARAVRDATTAGDLGGLSLPSAKLDALQSLAFRGTIGASVGGRADGEASARNLADAARGLVALGRIGAGREQARAWLEFLDGIRVGQSGSDLSLHASIPPATMQAFVEQMVSVRRQQAVSAADHPAAPAAAPAAGSPPAASQGRQDSGAQGGRPARPAPSPRDTRSPERDAPGSTAAPGSSSAAPPAS
ncbi:MAG: hypothetical protein AUH92_00485 [Acidobacteria bacterium 13_1_40CM_4_69_4]|nr:MAG: hypothetical protein AUH92_00485 [Acidobacteria bacterium 13_1_40CM_4_69_4]